MQIIILLPAGQAFEKPTLARFLPGTKLVDLDTVDKITTDHVLHVHDYFDQDYVSKILQKGTPYAIVSDHMVTPPYSDPIPFYGLPLYIEKNTKSIVDQYQFSNNISTVNCFNFMINKKQVNRFLCIKFVEWFKLTNFDYTWSAIDQRFDMSNILAELDSLGDQSPLDQPTRSFMLASIQLKKRFIEYNNQVPDDSNQYNIGNHGGPAWAWRNGLQELFSTSAISLITESLQYQKCAIFTEKTVYSVLGLTFPIWVGGGYNQATEWKRLGFDVFDDIIDHSYQSYSTLIERCYYAFVNNLHLLSSKDKSAELRSLCHARLLKNRELLLQNHLGSVVDAEISKYPPEIQSCMPDILKHFR
jgi:hypothetical protein